MKNKTIIILVIFLSLFVQSCRTAKKNWVEENFTSKTEIQAFQETFETSIETVKTETSETISEIRKEVSNSRSTNETTSESENTTVTVDITAEDGKEKSATVGGTTITSNGANVKVTTNSSKEVSREFQEKFQEISIQLNSEKQLRETLQSELTSLKKEFSDFRLSQQTEKTTKTVTVKKKGFTAPVWIIIALVVLIIAVIWYFRKKIPFI
ncbi:MAG: hypothetical protein KDC74_10070 [Flavobacteriaceae bacterium]|nr:hypothetical protein [Flavobacteriaceae bacterium]